MTERVYRAARVGLGSGPIRSRPAAVVDDSNVSRPLPARDAAHRRAVRARRMQHARVRTRNRRGRTSPCRCHVAGDERGTPAGVTNCGHARDRNGPVPQEVSRLLGRRDRQAPRRGTTARGPGRQRRSAQAPARHRKRVRAAPGSPSTPAGSRTSATRRCERRTRVATRRSPPPSPISRHELICT